VSAPEEPDANSSIHPSESRSSGAECSLQRYLWLRRIVTRMSSLESEAPHSANPMHFVKVSNVSVMNFPKMVIYGSIHQGTPAGSLMASVNSLILTGWRRRINQSETKK